MTFWTSSSERRGSNEVSSFPDIIDSFLEGFEVLSQGFRRNIFRYGFFQSFLRKDAGQLTEGPQGDHVLELLVAHFDGDLRGGNLCNPDILPRGFLENRKGIHNQEPARFQILEINILSGLGKSNQNIGGPDLGVMNFPVGQNELCLAGSTSGFGSVRLGLNRVL